MQSVQQPLLYECKGGLKVRTVPADCVRGFLSVDLFPMGLNIHTDERPYSTTNISGSTMISDFTELATRLYFWAASRARRVFASTASLFSSPRAIRITGLKCRRVKISVRSSSISFVPSVRHSKDNSLRRKRSVAQMNIIITQLFAAATNASSGVRTPACPWASGGAENFISGPFPISICPQWSPVHLTVV